jgi:hypothetical protein
VSNDTERAPARQELGIEEFNRQADALGVPPEIRPDLYPMVRDLKALAGQINDLAPGLHEAIPLSALRTEAGD